MVTRSPAYGHRTRPPHRRRLFVLAVEPAPLRVTVGDEHGRAWAFPARDQGAAVCMVELLRQGAFVLAENVRAHG